MKKIVLLSLLFFCIVSHSQNSKITTKYIYDALVKLDEFSKAKDSKINNKIDQFAKKYNLKNNDSLNGFYHMIIANSLSDQLKKDEAIVAIKKSNAFYTKANNKKGISKSFMNLGNLYLFKGDQVNALLYYNKGLDVAEKNNLIKIQGFINKNIGVLFMNQEKYDDALIYSNKALSLFEKINDKKEIAGAYINIGNVYFNQYNSDKALFYYLKGEKICLEINDNFNLGTLYNNIGSVYFEDKKDNVTGLKYLKKALEYKTKYNSINEIIFQHTNLADFYTNNKDFINAEYHLQEAEKMALKSNNKVELQQIYSIYSNTYAIKNDYKNALKNYKLHTVYKDSILNIESLKSVKELETKYQTAKKEKLLLEKELEVKKKNNLIYSLLVIALFISLVGFLIYRQQKLKNTQQEQEFKLKEAISEIENQNNLHEQRLSISRDLHDNIGAQLTFIISSVDNLQFANQKLETKINNQLSKISNFTKATIIELRDTIWAMNSNEFTFEDLRSRIFNFIEKAQSSQENIQFNFTISEAISEIKISALLGINIYRTIQEAVNNAIKYSDASTINVAINQLENLIEISIIDNGKGFDLDNTIYGNGLINMRKRIEEIDGNFEINSVINKGTKINFNFKKL